MHIELLLLPFLLGVLTLNATVDHPWYWVIGTDSSQLKSKVTAVARSAAVVDLI